MIEGATGRELLIASTTLADSGTIDCIVTGSCGSATSAGSTLTVVTHCPADLGQQGGVAGADNALDNNTFVAFIDAFFSASAVADMGSQGGVAGSDGQLDNSDFIVFIDHFLAGC